jgi:hypothetical protein
MHRVSDVRCWLRLKESLSYSAAACADAILVMAHKTSGAVLDVRERYTLVSAQNKRLRQSHSDAASIGPKKALLPTEIGRT